MRVVGCDVSAEFIIAHDRKRTLRIEEPTQIPPEWENAIFVIEQTGAYGVRWAEILSEFGKVVIADGKSFKRFRLAHTSKKNDELDALYLREYYLKNRDKCRPYNPHIIYTRALIRQHIRNNKDITKHINRIYQYLLMIEPKEKKPTRYKLIKELDKIEQRLKQTPHALTDLVLSEIEKLRACLKADQKIRQELTNIARNHPDYPILRTFGIGDIQIACILAYSWNIEDFKNKDQYIGYVCMGSNVEQSGKTIYRTKTDKARTEIKGLLYPLYMSAHKENHPLKPLTEHIKELANGRHNSKKRYIKFLSRLLELTYYARKERTDYATTLKNAIDRRKQELSHTLRKEEKEKNLTRARKIYTLTRSIKTYESLLKLAQCQDISLQEEDLQEPRVYSVPENEKEASHEKIPDRYTNSLDNIRPNLPPPTTLIINPFPTPRREENPHPPPFKGKGRNPAEAGVQPQNGAMANHLCHEQTDNRTDKG